MGPHVRQWESAVPLPFCRAVYCLSLIAWLRTPRHLLERGGRVSGRGEVCFAAQIGRG